MLRSFRSTWGWLAVAILVIANVPLMLCMPLPADAALYDLQAKTALTGGILYRDIVEPNLPGIVWCHMAIRSAFGWSEAALKWVDLVVVAGIVSLLLRLIGRTSPGQSVLAAFAFVAVGFYCSTPEWVHCQRDIWLMLPALGAFSIRVRRLTRPGGPASQGFLSSLIEGALWACAFWIKPYVAVPAAAAVAASLLGRRSLHEMVLDISGVLAGGAIIGAAGSTWMIATGVWPHFLEQMLEWNPVYFANGRARWTLTQYLSLSRDLAPWCLVHLATLPVAMWVIGRAVLAMRSPRDAASADCVSTLLAALYLGWMIQAHFLQHPFHYCHTPTVILAAALLAACWPREWPRRRVANFAFAGSLAFALVMAPAFDPQRLAWWPDCITRGAQPDVKCALHHRNLPNWVELQPVIDFLRNQNLQDGELTAYNVFLVHLYPEVGVRPSTRYVFLDVLLQVFHAHEEQIHEALATSRQRFVVCSLLENGMSAEAIAAEGTGLHSSLPAAFPKEHAAEFPYCLPLVFRSGQYVVYRADRPMGALNTTARPLAVK
ncbi:hypothetical protein Pan44_23980 [Caulifigura coniformis]|uniref:Glycosyltransferase RgtA/B/C/D-like domain-containing protein n=1 Tax=Caulifigura coniformis TaxID=2527983 RepID=A0A517SE16_9PLAN|nr:hypothetical protein [Caulifigura coniformis]QDT54365.1 hypothetical protein Pan44_23980 [Caulifigura coniformis]